MIQESLGFWIPRCEFWIAGTGFRLSVVLRFRIPFIRGIPDSSSRVVLLIPVFELPYIGGNDSQKQTGKLYNNYILWSYSHYQAISSVLTNVLLLDNVEEQNRNNEMPKGTRLGKTAFR